MVTGGISGNCEGGSTSCGVTTVAAYDENGWTEDLPTLNQGRFHHGCNSYIGQNNELVSTDLEFDLLRTHRNSL